MPERAPAYNAWNLPVRVADLDAGARVVTRQQLDDPAFLALVRRDLLDGSVGVVDEGRDWVRAGGREMGLDDGEARAILAESQAAWIGASPDPLADVAARIGRR